MNGNINRIKKSGTYEQGKYRKNTPKRMSKSTKRLEIDRYKSLIYKRQRRRRPQTSYTRSVTLWNFWKALNKSL